MTTDEARKALDIALSGSGMVGPWGETRAASKVIDAFAAAVRAETLAPPVKGSCYECGGVGCDDCDGTCDAGTQVLKLKNRLHVAELKCETLAPATRGQSDGKFYDTDGNECTLSQLCHREPEWAASRIRVEREEMGKLRAALAAAEAENAELRKLCERTANGLEASSRDASLKVEHFRGLLSGMVAGIKLGVDEAAARRDGK